MLKKINWKYSLISALIASVSFCITAFIYIKKAEYSASWVLYIGSAMFFFAMAVATVADNKKRGGNESTVSLVFASVVTTCLGIIISVFCCSILLLIMDKGFAGSGPASKILGSAPPAITPGKNSGLAFPVFFAATVLCFFGGFIAGVTLPFYTKYNQTKDNREPTPLQQHKTN